MNSREATKKIFLAGVAAAQPDLLVRRALQSLPPQLVRVPRIFVVGAGKASALMAREIESAFFPRLIAGCTSVKYNHSLPLRRLQILPAAHPFPDANSFRASTEILRVLHQVRPDDLLLCLWSGGASALLADGPPRFDNADLIALNHALVDCGASISEINSVRKHLSQLKGGQLARAVQPARVVCLILSDVIGDPLDVIASGPTAPDRSTFHDALRVLEKFQIQTPLASHLREGAVGIHPETPKPADPIFQNVSNIIIGNNRTALDGCQAEATRLGFASQIVTHSLQGDVTLAALSIIDAISAAPPNTCLLFGGETTPQVAGHGLGGRCQHLALTAALQLTRKPGVTLLAAGTDGTDGPTDAAGAIVDSETVRDPDLALRHLNAFDSHPYLRQSHSVLVTGATFTNVADIVVAIRR